MTPRLRCIVVEPFATLGGQEYWLLTLIDSTTRLDPEVLLLAEGPLRVRLEERQVPVAVLPTGASAMSVIFRILDLLLAFRRSEADVVLANGVKAAAVAVPAARLAGLPVVWAKHDFSFDRRLAWLLGHLADGVVANSEAVAEAVHRRDTLVVPPPRPDRVTTSAQEAREFWRGHGVTLPAHPVLAVVGRLMPYKGIDVAIRALAVPEAHLWSLVIIGPDDPSAVGEKERLKGIAAALDVEDRVAFTGEIPAAGRWLAAFDAVAVLTRQDSDGFGREGYSLVALEALAGGVPIVGALGNPEVVRMATEAGVVVPADDPRAVAQALVRLKDPTQRRLFAKAGGRLIESHPDAHSCTEAVVKLLTDIAARPGRISLGRRRVS